MRFSSRLAASFGLLVAATSVNLASCATLESIPENVCGNRVKDKGEDCDTEPETKRFNKDDPAVCGAPNAAGACHYLCGQNVGKQKSICPVDEVCGIEDGICRADPLAGAPGGARYAFEPLGPPIVGGAAELTAGDFDGDGVSDAIAIANDKSKLYLGSTKGLSSSFTSELVFARARAGRLTGSYDPPSLRAALGPPSGDPTDDVVFLLDGGIAVLTGQPGGAMSPAAFPKVDVPEPFFFAGFTLGSAKPNVPPIPTPWIFLDNKDPSCEGLLFAYVNPTPVPVNCFDTGMPKKSVATVSNALLAWLDPDPDTSCPQFAMGFLGDSELILYTPCQANGAFTQWVSSLPNPTVFKVQLPAGDTLTWGPLVYDMNGDGNLDLVAGTKPGGMVVGYGRGDLSFNSQADFSGTDGAAGGFKTKLEPWANDTGNIPIQKPLAIGDVNGDGLPDFVTAEGVYASISGVPGSYRLVYNPAPDTIESAAVGDFNGDGLVDVALARKTLVGAGEPELLVLLTSTQHIGDVPLFDPNPVPFGEAVEHVITGDFNGDGLADVAFAQIPRGQLGTVNGTVTVVYGDTGGNLAGVSMGELRGVDALAPLEIFNPGGLLDGISDLGVLSSYVDTTVTPPVAHDTAAALTGRPGHLMFAPLGLSVQVSKKVLVQSLPMAVTPGRFFASDQQDLGSIALLPGMGKTPDKIQLWWAKRDVNNPTQITQSFEPSDPNTGLDIDGFDLDLVTLNTFVGAAAAAPLDGGLDWLIAAIGGAKQTRVFYAAPGDPAPKHFDLDAVAGNTNRLRVEAADLGSGSPSVLVLADTKLFVLPNPHRQPPGDAASITPLKTGVQDFALLPVPGTKTFIVAIATTSEVFLFDQVHPAAAEGGTAEPYAVDGASQLDQILAIASGDFDGDRLPDLAIATTNAIGVFHMVPGYALPLSSSIAQ